MRTEQLLLRLVRQVGTLLRAALSELPPSWLPAAAHAGAAQGVKPRPKSTPPPTRVPAFQFSANARAGQAQLKGRLQVHPQLRRGAEIFSQTYCDRSGDRRASYCFLPYGYVPGLDWLCMPANGDGAGAAFFLFLSCFGFFFSLLLRI